LKDAVVRGAAGTYGHSRLHSSARVRVQSITLVPAKSSVPHRHASITPPHKQTAKKSPA